MSLSTNQILQLIKKYSRVSNHNDHDLLENIGTLTHEQIEDLLKPKVNIIPHNANIIIDCSKDAMFAITLEDDANISFNNLPDNNIISTILLELKSINSNQYNILIDSDLKDWANNDKLVIVEATKRYLISILFVGQSYKFINYLEFKK